MHCPPWNEASWFDLFPSGMPGPTSLYYVSRTLLPARTRAFIDYVSEVFQSQQLAERFAGSIG